MGMDKMDPENSRWQPTAEAANRYRIEAGKMRDLVDIFADMPDERITQSGRDYAHDPLDDLEADCWERFTQDWERED